MQVYGGDYSGRSTNEMPPRRLGICHNGGCSRLVRDRILNFKIKEFLTQKRIYVRLLAWRLQLSEDGELVDHGLSIHYFETSKGNQYMLTIFDDLSSKLVVCARAPLTLTNQDNKISPRILPLRKRMPTSSRTAIFSLKNKYDATSEKITSI